MNKLSIIFCILLIVGASLAIASPPAPSPTCRITGTIIDVEYQRAHKADCLKDKYGCPTDRPTRFPTGYNLEIRINTQSHVRGDTNYITCKDMVPEESIKTIFINKENVKEGDKFKEGEIIRGEVSSFFRLSFNTYNLLGPFGEREADTEKFQPKVIPTIFIALLTIGIFVTVMYFIKKSSK